MGWFWGSMVHYVAEEVTGTDACLPCTLVRLA